MSAGARGPTRLHRPVSASVVILLVLAAVTPTACAGGRAAAAAPAAGPALADSTVDSNTRVVPGKVMVTLPESSRRQWDRITHQLEIAYRLRVGSTWSMRSLGVRCVIFEFSGGRSLERTIERLAADPRVETAQPVYTFTALGGGDPYLPLQRGAEALGISTVHRVATGKGVKVAVIDTGVDVHHPDLAGRIARTGNFVGDGGGDFFHDVHGTAVAGILAASADNAVGIAGVAPGAEVFALKACWQRSADDEAAVCDSYSLVKAFDFALAEGAQVVNLSLAGPRDPLLARLITGALAEGVTVVAAAGANGGSGIGFPASLDGVIAVRASGPGTAPASLDERGGGGGRVLAAPGVDILTTVPGGGYDFFSGSSMAAAQVSGVVALLLERQPGLAPARVAGLLRDTAQPVVDEARDGRGGGGGGGAVEAVEAQVDACGAVSELMGVAACGPPLPAARLVR